ncbi:hypothetical protein D9M68_893230 [compost metagenome]
MLALQQAACAVLLARVLAGASVARKKETLHHSGSEHFVNVFFVYPGHAEPVHGRLQNDEVGPDVALDFRIDVVALFDVGTPDFMPHFFNFLFHGFEHGSVQHARRDPVVALVRIDEKHVFHL